MTRIVVGCALGSIESVPGFAPAHAAAPAASTAARVFLRFAMAARLWAQPAAMKSPPSRTGERRGRCSLSIRRQLRSIGRLSLPDFAPISSLGRLSPLGNRRRPCLPLATAQPRASCALFSTSRCRLLARRSYDQLLRENVVLHTLLCHPLTRQLLHHRLLDAQRTRRGKS